MHFKLIGKSIKKTTTDDLKNKQFIVKIQNNKNLKFFIV